jgi:hypothetical protein
MHGSRGNVDTTIGAASDRRPRAATPAPRGLAAARRLPHDEAMMKTLTALLLVTGLLACAAQPASVPADPDAQPASVPADAKAVREQITAEIGAASCTQDTECQTLPLGHKACGGPEAYVAWSSRTSNPERLHELGRRYAELSRADNEQSGMISNCMVTPDPGAQCTASRCVLREGAGLPAVQAR